MRSHDRIQQREVAPRERSKTARGRGATVRIVILRPTDVSERVFCSADHSPSPRGVTRGLVVTRFSSSTTGRSFQAHPPRIAPLSRSLRGPPRFIARAEHGENAGAAPPSSDAARTVTRKIPRDAVVVINILRSMAARVFSFRDP